MYIPIDILLFIGWIFIGVFCSYKQYRTLVDRDVDLALGVSFLAFVCGPIWLVGATFRQLVVEKWK